MRRCTRWWTGASVLALLAAGPALSISAHAQTQAPAKPAATKAAKAENAIERFSLANGLEVIVIPNHRVAAVNHTLWYRVGAADDPVTKSGIAHFHEHVMFLGTARYKRGEYSDIITRNGGQQNAFTGHDATAYYIMIAKEKLGLAMELEADRMRGLQPADDAVLKEREVIIEERRQRIENSPQGLLGEQVMAALLRHHPYRVPVIGWKHEMEGLTKQDVLDFHRRWYHPNNAILIVSGDVTAGEVRTLAERHYGSIPRAEVPKRQWTDEPPQRTARHLEMHSAEVKQPEWERVYSTSSYGYGNKAHALPLFIFAHALGGGKSSELYQELVVKQKLATDASADYQGFSMGPGVFSISVTPAPGISMDAVERAVDAVIAKQLKDTISDRDLKRAKTLLKAETIYMRDGLSGVAMIMGWLRILNIEPDFLERWPALVEAVTLEDVMIAAKEALQPSASVSAVLLPESATPEKKP
jgi:zinc protease